MKRRIVEMGRSWWRTVAGEWQPALRSFISVIVSFALPAGAQVMPPPSAQAKPVTNSYYGVEIVDPYRWMEEANSSEVRQWMKAQSDYARATLDGIACRRQLLAELQRLDSTLDTFPGALNRVGSSWFYMRTPPPSDVYQLFMREELDGEETLIFDPQTLNTPGGSHYSLNFYHVDPNGRYVICPVFQGGSEDTVLRVLDVETKRLVDQPIDRCAFGGVCWLPDSSGFFYSRLPLREKDVPGPTRYAKRRVYLHQLGSDIATDRPIFGYGVSTNVPLAESFSSSVDAAWGSSYAVGQVRDGVGPYCELYVTPLPACKEAQIPWRKVCGFSEEIVGYTLQDDALLLHSRKNAPRGKVLRISCAEPDIRKSEVLLPEGDRVLGSVVVARDAVYATMRDEMASHLIRIAPGGPGEAREVKLPVVGSISRVLHDPRREGVILALVSWSEPSAYYSFDPATAKFSKIAMAGDASATTAPLEVNQVLARSKDGTQVPLTILCRRGLELDGRRPTLLFGYGAYGMSQTPSFELSREPWFKRGGVYAVAHVRGGGEFGATWHHAGKGPNKMNGVADFIAGAEYLIAERYTSPQKLAAQSISAGGVLLGRAVTERPDLFRAAVIESGALDALRFEVTPNGPPNIPEWGSTQTKDGFETLRAMSPYEHIEAGKSYPALLFTTGINDPRVEPWQSCKMVARLQGETMSRKPILLSVNYDEGHFQTTVSSMNEHQADIWSFLLWQLGETPQEVK